jgi:hypothetical protein
MSMARFLKRLRQSRSGVAMTEFALGAPLLLMAGLWGAETANFALVNMKIGQLAVHVADNASRVGDTSTLQDRKVYESDINDVFYGAQLQTGGLDLYNHGRVVISSLQVNPDTDEQVIRWQRCRGVKPAHSAYGSEGDSVGAGMGPVGAEVFAQPDDAVIYVEVAYTYQPLVSLSLVTKRDILTVASFTVRDDRDISQLYQRDSGDPDPIQTCSTNKGPMQVGSDGKINS